MALINLYFLIYKVMGSLVLAFIVFIYYLYNCGRSWDSEVNIATGYGLDGRGAGVLSPDGGRGFLLSMLSRLVLGTTHLPIQWVPVGFLPSGKAATP
jgi:hypothetical protein